MNNFLFIVASYRSFITCILLRLYHYSTKFVNYCSHPKKFINYETLKFQLYAGILSFSCYENLHCQITCLHVYHLFTIFIRLYAHEQNVCCLGALLCLPLLHLLDHSISILFFISFLNLDSFRLEKKRGHHSVVPG